MVKIEIPTDGKKIGGIKRIIQEKIYELDPDAVVRIQLVGSDAEELQRSLTDRSFEQLGSHLSFKNFNVVADGGLSQMQVLGSFGETQIFSRVQE